MSGPFDHQWSAERIFIKTDITGYTEILPQLMFRLNSDDDRQTDRFKTKPYAYSLCVPKLVSNITHRQNVTRLQQRKVFQPTVVNKN